MAAAPPSYESEHRRAFRLACGVTMGMALIQVVPWPAALLAPTIANALLQDAKPMPFWIALKTLGLALLAILSGFLLSLALLPYPVVLVLALALVLYGVYYFALTTGEHVVIVIGLIVGNTLIPVLQSFAPELAYVATLGVMMSFTAAFVIAAISFAVIPPPAKVPPGPAAEAGDASGNAATLALVVTPLLAAFLMFGLTDVLVLIFTALIAMTLSRAGSIEMGLSYVKANLVLGGIAMIVVYEILVMAPFLPLMISLVFLAMYVFAMRFFSHAPNAAAWSSGSFGFILLLAGVLGKDDIVTSAKVIDRASQIAMATIYVALAYVVLEYIRAWRRRTMDGARNV